MRKSTLFEEKDKTTYQLLAKQYDVSVSYIGKIARGERMPKSKKGKEILAEIQKLINGGYENT